MPTAKKKYKEMAEVDLVKLMRKRGFKAANRTSKEMVARLLKDDVEIKEKARKDAITKKMADAFEELQKKKEVEQAANREKDRAWLAVFDDDESDSDGFNAPRIPAEKLVAQSKGEVSRNTAQGSAGDRLNQPKKNNKRATRQTGSLKSHKKPSTSKPDDGTNTQASGSAEVDKTGRVDGDGKKRKINQKVEAMGARQSDVKKSSFLDKTSSRQTTAGPMSQSSGATKSTADSCLE